MKTHRRTDIKTEEKWSRHSETQSDTVVKWNISANLYAIQCYNYVYHSFVTLVIVNIAGTVQIAAHIRHQHSHLTVVLLRKILKIFWRQFWKTTVSKFKENEFCDPEAQFS